MDSDDPRSLSPDIWGLHRTGGSHRRFRRWGRAQYRPQNFAFLIISTPTKHILQRPAFRPLQVVRGPGRLFPPGLSVPSVSEGQGKQRGTPYQEPGPSSKKRPYRHARFNTAGPCALGNVTFCGRSCCPCKTPAGSISMSAMGELHLFSEGSCMLPTDPKTTT